MIGIIGAQGSHPAVPEQKIQSVIPLEVPVVLVVGHRGVDPPSEAGAVKSGRVQFPAQVAVYIVYDHEKEENEQVKFMQGEDEQEHDQNTDFHDAFQGMECISGPGRRIHRLMMYQVEGLKEAGMVHHPVCPIEIGIVNEQHQREDGKKIEPAQVIEVFIT